ncbi:MAG: hypothetical protein ACI9TK_000820 [Flavobacteriaceae bacterium]|jgi:hypothetical protein|tara:strand:- start:10660 stop:10905 length:246 start_codon:yes stop_codon:yes gene_type:complete
MKQSNTPKKFLFGKRNYRFLFLALAIITLGFILMVGGGSDDPLYFNEAIFNFRRIRLAPTIVLLGFGVVMYSILTHEASKK